MELIVQEYERPQPIKFNFEELKAELTEKVAHYEMLVYTDDQIKEAKADRANLNKLKKALNDERLRREREYMEPFADFKAKINEIITIIDKPVAVIDAQVKAYEEKCRAEKRADIEAYFDDLEAKPDWLALDMIWDESWLNASCSMKSVQTEISEAIARVNANVDTLKSLPQFSFEALEVYKGTLDMNRAIQEGARLADIQRRKEEQEKLEEQKAREVLEPEPEIEPRLESEPMQWVGFAAYMTVADALELKRFFEERGIKFKRMPLEEVHQ